MGVPGFLKMYESEKEMGNLVELQDSSVVFYSMNQGIETQMPVTDINLIEFKKSGTRFGQGFMIGAVGGFVLGAVSAASYPDLGGKSSSGDAVVVGGLLFGALGGMAGGIVGGFFPKAKITIPINAKQSNYNREKARMKIFSLRY